MKKSMLLLAVAVCLVAVNAAASVKICRANGVDIYADETGSTPVSTAFTLCIADPAVTVINLPPGTYLVDEPIVITRPNFTIRTAGLAGNTQNCQQLPAGSCAILLASWQWNHCINDGTCFNGFVQAYNTYDVTLDHLIFDGSKTNRASTYAATLCGTDPSYGFNVRMAECGGASATDRCEFTYNLTRNALCGTGLQFAGNYALIQGNAAFNNGTSARPSDGLTIERNNNGIVNDNRAYNNTKFGIRVGTARNSQIQSNWIQQNGVYAAAGLVLGNFTETQGAGHSGDFTYTNIRYNTINCYNYDCGFGLDIGPDPWKSSDTANTRGGLVTANNINAARVLINFGGAGISTNRVTVTNNTLTNPPTYSMQLSPGSSCYVTPNVLQNLPNNNSLGICGNFADVDPIATSYNCYLGCYP